MSFKSIEMQVALPRTQDAGKLQDQMSKQNQNFQSSLAQSQSKQEKLKRRKVNTFADVNHLNIDSKGEDSSHNNSDKSGNHQQGTEKEYKDNEETEHPYLGANIDYSR